MRKTFLFTFILPLLAATQACAAQSDLIDLYEHLHANPELSFQEKNTAARIAQELRDAGFTVTEGVGGHGVVALLHNGAGPTLMLRTDMDALPIVERTNLPYASKVHAMEQTGQEVGVMHACGHDIHMTAVIGAARELAGDTRSWNGTLMVIAQPAEERGAGARMMLDDGLFVRFARPDFNIALHVDPTRPAGTVSYVSGWALANVDSVDVTVHGVGGHGAYPHTTKDPVVVASAIVMALQTLVSREISPVEPAVVTVGSLHAGAKHNVISDRANLQLTVRSYTDEVRDKLLAGIERVAKNQARVMGVAEDMLPDVEVKDEYTPALWNDPELVARGVSVMRTVLGADKVFESSKAMGGEDFARYGREGIPSFMFRLGTISPERYQAAQQGGPALPSLHSPFYYPEPEASIRTGVKTLAALARDLLSEQL